MFSPSNLPVLAAALVPVTPTAPAMGGKKKHPGKAILAGGIAGGIEICITYPTEFVKTQLQLDERATVRKFSGPLDCARQTVSNRGVLGLYKGLPSLFLGSVPKAAVRFGSYEFFSKALGAPSKTKTFMAGLMAGTTEAILVVCPMETIKVKIIHDQNRAVPQYKNFFHGVREIVRQEGLGGVYKGLTATILRQGTNQAMRFVVYNEMSAWWASMNPGQGDSKPVYQTLISGALAGTVSVYGNTPIDVIKTRMQGLEASKYKGFVDCATQIWKHEGFKAFYKGTTPRLARVASDVAIVMTLYEQIMMLLDKVWVTK